MANAAKQACAVFIAVERQGFSGAFQRIVQRRRPLPVGSRLIIAMQTHFNAAASEGKRPRARTALRMPPTPVEG
ncbi:hypothetical protein I3F60_11905 [Streptomyces sp. MUM 136J]|nr:hypothetical protein [Streptomyces sp. MUM 2J]MCH0569945.1 hypothetical protein [Streptomyces sp. MUM 136J]